MVRTVGKRGKIRTTGLMKNVLVRRGRLKHFLKRIQRSKKESTECRGKYVRERKEYEQLLKSKKTEFDQLRIDKIRTID